MIIIRAIERQAVEAEDARSRSEKFPTVALIIRMTFSVLGRAYCVFVAGHRVDEKIGNGQSRFRRFRAKET